MGEFVYDSEEGEFVDFATLEDWEMLDKAKTKRIEELEAKLDDKEAECRSLRGQVNMAIGALQKVQDFVRELEPYTDQGHTLVPALHHACTVLNRLQEDRDEV